MSHISTIALTTTPPVTVVSSGLSSVSSVTSLTEFPVSLDQHGMVPPPPLMLRGSGGVLGSVSVPQHQPPSSMSSLAYANYAMGSPHVGFFFRVEPPIICILYMFGVCSGVCFLLLGAELDAVFTYGGSTIMVCTLATLWSLPMAGICATWWWSMVHTWFALSGCSLWYLGVGWRILLLILLCPNQLVGYMALGLHRVM